MVAISVIVVSYNSAAVLPDCLDALHEHLKPQQLLVVDNASSDSSVAIARACGAELVESAINKGFGAGCNLGAKAARHELLLFVNPDVRLTSADSAALMELGRRRPMGLVAPRVLRGERNEQDEPTRHKVVPWPRLVAREALGPILPRELSRRMTAPRETRSRRSWITGALILAARDEFLRLGGFDERLFLYYEDQELSRRYVRHGMPISVTDAITGRHEGGGSSGVSGVPRPIPRAASAVSSIELVGILHGPLAARCAWVLYRGLQGVAFVLVGLAARGPWAKRSAQKQRELHGTRQAMHALLTASDIHYPLVKSLSRT